MAKISACVITYNEEQNIARCLESLSFADDIIVVDSQSTDRTVEIARKFTPNVISHQWMGFGPQKNLAFLKAGGDWIISIDADEQISPSLREEILLVLKEPQNYTSLSVPIKSYISNHWIKYGACFHNFPDYQSRIFLTGHGQCYNNLVHESMITTGKVKFLHNPILHYAYKDLKDYRRSLNYYGRLKALDLLEQDPIPLIIRIFIYPLHVLLTFINYYLFKKGCLMGWIGAQLAFEQMRYVAIKYWLNIKWKVLKKSATEIKNEILEKDRT